MWYLYLLIVLLAILVLWWLLTRQASFTDTSTHSHQEHMDSHDEGGHTENQEVHVAVLPAVETRAEPVVETLVEPVVEPFVEPVVETRAEPVEESFVEPVVEPFVEPVVETRVEPVAVSPTVPDDLVIIEGIGPKIASVLAAAGISTFYELAATDPEKIKSILFATDPRLARISDPTTWPEQARLAASGDTVGLQRLQDSLKGGRQE